MKQKLLNLFLILFVSSFSFAQVANQPSDLMVCDDDNDGFFLFFNLTFADAEVLGGQNPADFIVTYHETQSDAENGVNALQSPYGNVVPSLQTIYVRLEEISSGNFDTTTLDLIVNFSPIPTQPSSLDLCDDTNDGFAEFDLTVKNAEIIGANTNVSVTYYETISDAENQTNPISNPTSYTNLTNPQTLFLRLTDLTNGCSYFYTSGNLTIRVLPSPDLLENPDDIEICDDGSGFSIFDLTTNESFLDPSGEGFLMNYYVSLVDADSGTNAISNPENYVNTSNPQEIYVRVENDVTGCYTLTSFDIWVNSLPEVVAVTDFVVCQINSEGIANFDLTYKDEEVLDGLDPVNFYVTYYATIVDAQTQSNALLSPWINTSNPETIYFTITNYSSGCTSAIQSFDLIVNEGVQANPSMSPIIYEQCDDNIETDGDISNDSVQFDLSNMDAQVIGGQDPSEFTVSYFATLIDADMGINPLPVLYQNISNPQIIYARLENNNSVCYDTTEATLLVNPLPYFSISDIAYCQGESVVIDTGLDSNNYYFSWYYEGANITGETQATLTVTQPGVYSVSATSVFGCGITSTEINIEEVDCTDSDSDGVIDSDEDINGNGNLDDDDTDNDGIPNYLDSDDDGDNIPTEVEVGEVSGRNSSTVLHQFIDTDNDSIENYLDNDDDGDGVLTIDEDYNNNGDPTDDDTNSNMIPDYLEAAVALNVNNFNVEAFKIYPNPAKATLYIQMDNIYSNVEVSIYDVQGKQIGLSKTLSSNITELDVSNFESGIYFVKLSNDEISVTEKLVIQ
ncbi:T9SS type A sorting domain-containing protein [Winogradskyella sp. SYSU M77433]|uniref:T9SS type A sorting domain-containing protein n=1 Tax=Winogradskyella sp. SYSU M77433 TaxID=3042722 RepID=UPI002480A7CE|nr:T9SS type A sorting domain-containing protein [Winogradskyella sp. SYSU M77433]MDH7911152.1 T9SS type A sorting domain-containing protein [Winogradskyella sp. SYSU M77433]